MLKRTLTIIDSSGNMSEIDLNQFGKTLLYMGRDESQCDIIIADPIVSKIHGTFQLEHSYLLYRDEDSSNGTYLGSAEKRKMLEKKDGYVDLYDQSIMRIGNIHEPEKMVLILYQMTDEYQMWKRQSLDKSEILIGRNSSNQIVLNHPGISKKHCAIYKKDSKMILCDLNSANGVMVNGSPVRQYRELMDKDIIQILDFQLFYSNTCIYYRALTSGISLRACDINKTVGKGRKKKKILQSVNCEIHPNEFVAIIGGSGAGKTTLMNAISGFEKEFSGNVYCNGINLIEQFQYMKNIIGFVPQQDIIYENLTLKRMLLYTAKLKMPEDTQALKVDMVADVSGSMSGTPLSEAQMCMANFVNSMQFDAGDQVELTSFATGVRLEQEFTDDASSLIDEINDLVTGDMTSLYDALYTAVERVATQSGARCVIAFTDGNDNYSDCSVTDVVNVASRYHVPVFIIGIGSVDTTDLYTITNQTGGEYYNINAVNSMQEIYEKIYRMEKQLYMVEFEDGTGADINDQSDIKTGYKSVKYGGECNYTYTPNVLLSAGSATLYKDGPEAVVEEYLKNFDDAVNHSDFSLISNCLQKGSPIYTEQEKYVQRDISEQLDSYELTDVSYSDENNCVISTRETYYVQVSGEALQLMTQECKYSLVKENGNWFMTSFVDINVVSRIKQ